MGLALRLGLIVLGNVERAELLLAHVDASAPSVQNAIQGDLSGTAQDDGAPRIDLDQRTAPQLQRLAGGIELPEDIAVAACLQVQVRPSRWTKRPAKASSRYSGGIQASSASRGASPAATSPAPLAKR